MNYGRHWISVICLKFNKKLRINILTSTYVDNLRNTLPLKLTIYNSIEINSGKILVINKPSYTFLRKPSSLSSEAVASTTTSIPLIMSSSVPYSRTAIDININYLSITPLWPVYASFNLLNQYLGKILKKSIHVCLQTLTNSSDKKNTTN